MGLILGRKYGGKGEREKGQGGKAKMTASSHWISIQLVGGRKRGKICEGTKKVCISFLLRNFFSVSVSLPVFSCLTPYTGHSFFPFSIVSDLCHAAIQHTHEQLIDFTSRAIKSHSHDIRPCAKFNCQAATVEKQKHWWSQTTTPTQNPASVQSSHRW